MPLTSSQWQQVESLFSLAMQLPSEQRYDWRRRTGPVELPVADEVDALITTCDDNRCNAPLKSAGPLAGATAEAGSSNDADWPFSHRQMA